MTRASRCGWTQCRPISPSQMNPGSSLETINDGSDIDARKRMRALEFTLSSFFPPWWHSRWSALSTKAAYFPCLDNGTEVSFWPISKISNPDPFSSVWDNFESFESNVLGLSFVLRMYPNYITEVIEDQEEIFGQLGDAAKWWQNDLSLYIISWHNWREFRDYSFEFEFVSPSLSRVCVWVSIICHSRPSDSGSPSTV
jgi:hypothetical protein